MYLPEIQQFIILTFVPARNVKRFRFLQKCQIAPPGFEPGMVLKNCRLVQTFSIFLFHMPILMPGACMPRLSLDKVINIIFDDINVRND